MKGMPMTETYLDMMETSLVKKIEVMKLIEAQNIRQKEALVMEDGFDEETFDDFQFNAFH